MSNESHPHGVCECDGGIVGGCCLGNGPAAYDVTRDGVRMRLCTMCDLSSDRDKRLLVTKEDDMDPFIEHDPLGAWCITNKIAEGRILEGRP